VLDHERLNALDDGQRRSAAIAQLADEFMIAGSGEAELAFGHPMPVEESLNTGDELVARLHAASSNGEFFTDSQGKTFPVLSRETTGKILPAMAEPQTETPLQREIDRRMKALGYTKRSLSLAAELSESTVKKIFSNGSKSPRQDTLEALARVLGCTVSDLTGETRRGLPEPLQRTVPIDELDVRASAGAGQIIELEGKVAEWQIPQELIRAATNSPIEGIKIISVVGDSMEPSFRPLDRVMVDTADLRPTPPGVFVVWDGLGLVVKRIEYVAHSEPPRVRIASDNSKYQAYERILGEAYIPGRVLGKWLWT
jgi:phage repressor protein C with HTH and peptisase S24 domain